VPSCGGSRSSSLGLSDTVGGPTRPWPRAWPSSGEEHPLPLLWRVSLLHEIQTDADFVTSLLLPGVRVFFELRESS
jgi:hypothetical protein